MFEINRKLLPLKTHYGLFNAGIAPMLAYGSVYARQAGLSAMTVGCMWTVLLATSVCVKITLSAIADKYQRRRLMFIGSVLLCIFAAVLLSFISTATVGYPIDILCHNETFLSSCHNHIDVVALNRIKRKNPEGFVTCRFSCGRQEYFAREICRFWQNKNDCESQITKEIQFDATIQKKHIFSVNECIYGTLAEAKFENTEGSISYPRCRSDIQGNCTVKCDNNELMNELKVQDAPLLNDLKHALTWILFVLFLCYMCGLCLNFSLTDTICFEVLGDKPHLYGQQRWFGALGFGVMTLLGGWLTDRFSDDTFSKNYTPMFLTAATVLLIDLILTFTIKIEQKVKPSSVVKDVSMIFYSARVIIFVLWCFLMGMFCGMCWEFLFWHLEDMSTVDDLQWIRTLQGLSILATTFLGEIPVFFVSGRVIKRLGHLNAMSLLLFSSAVRFFCYSMISRPFWVLPIELLSGFIFSMSYVIIASYSSLIALPGTESTVQAVFSATFEGLGMASGSLLGGTIYNSHNGYVLFSLMSYVALLAAIMHVLVQLKLPSIPNQRIPEGKTSTAVYTSPADAISILDTSP